jgi:hypothetical protein
MKRILAMLLVFSLLLAACAPPNRTNEIGLFFCTEINFTELDDPNLLRYIEDDIYANIISELDSDYYFVEHISAIYRSKEYLEQLAYNSQENIYFGFSLSELDEQFQGERFIFTLGENGQTVVQPFEKYDDTFDKIVRNVAVGTGVILLCVTVSVVSPLAGAHAVSVIFAASAKTGAIGSLSGGVFSGIVATVITGIKTGDLDQVLKAAGLAASDGFMWGAISGSVIGGAQAAIALKGATLNGLTMNQAAQIQRESKLPLDVIKQLNSMEQYEILKQAGLKPVTINGKTALVRGDINLDYFDETSKLTNLQRMERGLAALDPTGQPYELHHIGQRVDSTLAILSRAEHRQGGNDLIWHNKDITSSVHALGNNWNVERTNFWIETATYLKALGGI